MVLKLFLIVCLFIIVDIITGLLKAFKQGEFTSSCMREGLFHKCGELLAVGFGTLCEYAFPLVGVTLEIPLTKGIAIYIIFMETTSIVENLGAIAPAIAEILKSTFSKFKTDKEE